MLCDQVREHLSAYLDKELTADLSAAVRAHLDACAECRALADDLRATVGLLGRLPLRAAPKHLADDVLREIERRGILAGGAPIEPQTQERTLPMRRARLWPRALAVAATLALAVGIGVFAYLSDMGRKAPTATELASARKAVDVSEALDGWAIKAPPRPVAPGDDYASHAAAAPAKAPTTPELVLADRGKEAELGDKFGLLPRKDNKGDASQEGFLTVRAGDVAGQEPVRAVTLARGDDGAGQVTLNLDGMNVYTGGTVISGGQFVTENIQMAVGGQTTLLGAVPMTALPGVSPESAPSWNFRLGRPAAPAVGGVAYPAGGTITIAGAWAGSDATPKVGPTYFGTTAAAPAIDKAGAVSSAPATPTTELQVTAGYGPARPSAAPAAAQPSPLSLERTKSSDDLASISGRPASGPSPAQAAVAQTEMARTSLSAGGAVSQAGAQAAGETRYLRLSELRQGRDRAPLEKAMLAAAGGQAGTEQLSRMATSEALRAADNQLVLSVESPDEADRNLVELFKAAGWHALTVDRDRSALNKEEGAGGRRAGEDRSLAEAEENLVERRLPPGGVYYRATRNGEDVWLVLADRDSLSRFGSRLAQAQGLSVGAGSSAEFLAIRGLQSQLRSSAYANAKEPAPRISAEKDLGAKDLAMKVQAPAPPAKPAAGRQEVEGGVVNGLLAGKSAGDLKQTQIPAGGATGSAAAALESKSKVQAASAAPAPAEAPAAAPAPDDRILLVIRVQPVLADRAKTAPAATQPAEKP